jgi:hypothetical protein
VTNSLVADTPLGCVSVQCVRAWLAGKAKSAIAHPQAVTSGQCLARHASSDPASGPSFCHGWSIDGQWIPMMGSNGLAACRLW